MSEWKKGDEARLVEPVETLGGEWLLPGEAVYILSFYADGATVRCPATGVQSWVELTKLVRPDATRERTEIIAAIQAAIEYAHDRWSLVPIGSAYEAAWSCVIATFEEFGERLGKTTGQRSSAHSHGFQRHGQRKHSSSTALADE